MPWGRQWWVYCLITKTWYAARDDTRHQCVTKDAVYVYAREEERDRKRDELIRRVREVLKE